MVTTDDMKTLVGLLKPVIKAELEAGSTGVGTLEAVSSLEGVYSLPALRKRAGAITAVEAPLSLLKGEDGERGDSLEYRLLDSYPSLEALKAAYPSGTPENGFFIAGEGMYVWNPREGAFKEIRLDVDKVFTSEVFTEVSPSGDKVSIDFSATPYAKVALGQDHLVYDLDIRNTREGSRGKVMVYQTGLRQVTMGGRLRGTIDLPLNADTIAILSYNRVGEHVYVHTATVIGDKAYPAPQKIQDFQVTYSDSSSCTAQWTAPYANNIYDKGTEYDMRYANNLVNADDPKVWAGLRRVAGVPVPAKPGTLQKTTLSGLSPDKEYYVYLKTLKVNSGVEYLSPASDFAYFRTTGSEDTSKAYRISLTGSNLVEQSRNPQVDTDGTFCVAGRMVDERDRNVYLDNGYPDTGNKDYATHWLTYPYSRAGSPYDIVMDLRSVYSLDKLFLFSRGKPRLSVYGTRDIGYGWERVGTIEIAYNDWGSVDFQSRPCRFLKLSFDLMDFGALGGLAEGREGFPDDREYNPTIDRVDNIILYGRPSPSRPEGIMSPLRRSTARRTVDQFLCTNGHGYQQGRIHSMCSGERVRAYMAYGHFAVGYGTASQYASLREMRFRVDDIPWVTQNNGTGDGLEATLRDTWRRYGLKPYLTNTNVFDYCYYDRSSISHNRQLDNYWLPGAWRAAPSRGVGGLDRYMGVTTDAGNYRTVARCCQALASRYGRVDLGDQPGLFWPESAPGGTGLDLISGLEVENEPDQDWSGWTGYTHAAEYAAVVSASSDGHSGSLLDEDGVPVTGTRSGGLTVVSSGTAGVNRGYLLPAILHWKATRPDGSIPVDAFSMHMYFSNVGNQGGSQESRQYGITLEDSLSNLSGGELPGVCSLRDRLCPDKEIWLTEFGWGESGARDTRSKYQCYSQPGRKIGAWVIPDRHRSDVKGAWIVRACVQLMAMGVDMANHYSTECEGNYFDAGQWGSGAGNEMFHWNDCPDTTPGAKVEAIKPYECEYARGGFATTGLFGQLLGNGAYPITRAYWWVATFRNRLKGYVYTGMRYLERDERIVVACFRKRDGDKGAYVVYYNDSRNTGLEGVEIPLPDGVSSCRHVTVHVPNIPNPESVPSSLGWDKGRTGLPTSRKERYIDGKWVVQNRPYYQDRHMSYAKAPADYPAGPAEGDEITVLPTAAENPWFPIVGPVWAKASPRRNTLSAKQYEQDREDWEDGPRTDNEGNVIWTVREDPAYSWRQVDAVCDYIDFHPDGVRGAHGDEETLEAVRGMIRANVSEFPEFYLFDAAPDPDYRGEVADLSSRVVSSSTVELWWNNTGVEDTGYEIFRSTLPETGYALLRTVGLDVENKAVISGLEPDTTCYFKIRPVKGGKAGTLSDHVSARTYRDIQPPTDLRVEGRTATSVRLAWDYPPGQDAGFLSYAIYRSDDAGAYALVGSVDDRAVHRYEDGGLAVGRVYRYKARVMGVNGVSAYTDEVETRTLLPEEVSPALRSAMTDKLGIKVTLSFDLPLGAVPATAKASLALTEDGNQRLIRSVSRDEANHNCLVLSILEDSLSDYDKKSDIRVSYDGKGGILSGYGVPLEGFTGARVANVIGNFTNLGAVYQVNLCGPGSDTAPDWNNLEGEDDKGSVLEGLVDTYGRVSGVSVRRVHDGSALKWGSVYSDGHCEIGGVPEVVYRSQWGVAHGANVTESIKARLSFAGLDGERRYTVKAYGGIVYGSETLVKMRVGDAYSATLRELGNKTGLVEIEGVAPSGGVIDVDLINPVEGITTAYSKVGFVILEEYGSGDSPGNTDVWLRDATVLEDGGDGVVKSPDLTIHLNCVGKATHYRVGETDDLSLTPWTAIVDDIMDVPYALSPGFGAKTLRVQVKNPYDESNVRVIDVEHRDPYVPLSLKNIYVNDDDAVTYDRSVTVMVEMEGSPTHCMVSETADFAGAEWLEWPGPGVSGVGYALSDGDGLKTVYARLKDGLTESAVRADTIRYARLAKVTGTVTIPLPEGVTDASRVNISIAPLKYDKRFAFGYSVDDTSMQAYSVVQALYAGKWIDDADFCHLGAARTTGHVPAHPLYYTDGLGTRRYFAVSNYLITLDTGKEYGHHPLEGGTGYQNPYLRFDELKAIQDFDGDWMIHNVDETVWDRADPGSIARGMAEVNGYMEGHGVGRSPVSSHPDGNDAYWRAALLCDDVRAFLKGDMRDTFGMWGEEKMNLPRHFMTDMTPGNLKERLSAVERGSVRGVSALWDTLGGHRPRGKVGVDDGDWETLRAFLEHVHATYGGGGSDEVWFANDREVYEYLYLKRHTAVTSRIEGDNLVLTVEMPRFEGLKWFETTLLVDIDAVAASCDDNVYGFTYGMRDGRFMLNVNMMESLVERAERYTSRFEASERGEDMDDALYFIQRLKASLRPAFLARVNALSSPPSLVSFSIAAAETADPLVACDYEVAGKATHYMISEDTGFAGAGWLAMTPSPISFRLSNVAGPRDVYFKAKNAFGESAVKSDTVAYDPPAFGLSSIVINGGAASTTDKTLSVAFDVAGLDTPTHHMISETSDMVGAVWMDYRNPAPFSISSTGVKTLYARVKSGEKVSGVASDSIEVTGLSAVLSFGWDYTSGVGSNSSAYDATLRVTKVRQSSDGSHLIPIYNRDGSRLGTLTVSGLNNTGNASFQGNVTGDGSGVYPDDVLRRLDYKNASTERAVIRLSIPDGPYTIKVLVNTIRTFNLSRAGYVLESGGVSQSFPLKTSYVDNFHDLSELTVNVIEGVTLTMSTTDANNSVLLLNAIEIERV